MDSKRVALYELFRDSWDALLNEIEALEFGHMNEADIQCRLFYHISRNLKLTKQDQILGLLHAEVNIRNGPIDLVLIDPIDRTKTFAGIEIKHDPKPAGNKEDLTKLTELVSDGLLEIGIFVTLALDKYKLKQRLFDDNVLNEFNLAMEGGIDSGIVEWTRISRPQKVKTEMKIDPSIDAVFITLGTNLPKRDPP